MTEREQLEQAIAALEAQRALLGDAVVKPLIAAAREKLNVLSQTAPASPQRKLVTVLFADVSGFTAMSETMDAEDVTNTMNALWSRLDAAITSHGGLIDKHIGDAVMALFGAPTAHEDDSERAIRAALDMQSLSLSPLSISMRIGVNTGPVLLGQVGTTLEYTAMGDTVNLASRLEHAAPVGGILISHDTYRHVRGIFDVQALDPIAVKGKTEPVRVYVVRGVKPRAFRVPTRGVEGIETRTIGRDAELVQLQSALNAVIESRGLRRITIVGDAGVGKSRLLYEFDNRLELLPPTVQYFKGRADQQTSHLPYFLFRDLLAFRFEIKNSDCAALAREKLEQGIVDLVGAASPDARIWAHFIGHLIGLDFSDSPHIRGILNDARQIRDLAAHYLAQFFAAATAPFASPPQVPAPTSPPQAFSSNLSPASGGDRGGAAVLFLEDVHWADDGSLDLIERLASECLHSPLLIVTLTRPDLYERRPAWGEGPAPHTRLDLLPLSKEDGRHLVEEILRQVDQIPPDLRDMIVNRAEGNPYYIEELIRTLIEEDVIVKGPDRWRVEPGQLNRVHVPPTLVGILQARLDGLPLLEHEMLQRASVVGRVFWDGAVKQLTAGDSRSPSGDKALSEPQSETIYSALDTLHEKELVFERQPSAFSGEQEYIFKHSILHDVTYESVLRQQRRAYHAQVAAWLTEQSRERVAQYAGLIGEHYERADEKIKAAEWYGLAGKQAQDTCAPHLAIDYYQKALAALPVHTSEVVRTFGSPETSEVYAAQRIEWHRGLGLMLWQQTRFEQAAQAYTAMRAAAEAAGDRLAQAQAWKGLSQVQQAQGDFHAALESAGQAEEIAQAVGAPARELLAETLCHKGGLFSDLENAEKALALGEQALALSTELNNRRLMADSLNLLGWVHKTLERYEQATSYYEQALALFQELGDRIKVAGTLNDLGTTASTREDYSTAAALLQGALSTAREIGHRYAEIVVLNNLGEARIGLGEYQFAEADLRQVIEAAESAGLGLLPETYCLMTQACLGQGKSAEALAAAQRAIELGRESGLQEFIGGAWRALGMVLADSEVRGQTPEGGEVGTGALRAPGEQVEPSPEDCFTKSLQIFTEMGMESERARTLRVWAKYEIERDNGERGERMWREAQDILRRLGAKRVASGE